MPQKTDHVARPTREPNLLARESSPYLLQHAYNPVDWHPWGSGAFEEARASDRPIFLSIGYSTCYWCHVMERECFENEAIARAMNERFVCVKVDREQRPDVDDLYMLAIQLMTGSGGWPMSIFLEPRTLKPFFGGTYFPPEDRYGRPGFPAILHAVSDAWTNNREALLKQSQRIADAIQAHVAVTAVAKVPDQSVVERAVADLMATYDHAHGGFGGAAQGSHAPKFPQPANLDFLMTVAWARDDVRRAVLHTLDRMATGGMFDQVGGGFHRYSVDERWLVPHFEKMLYDNAQLASTYARAFQLTSDEFYRGITNQTIQYVLREMTSSEGLFFSAQDAEVESREGGNYLWSDTEIREALVHAGMNDEVDFALSVFGVSAGPNFRDPHHPQAQASNVLFLPERPNQLASRHGQNESQFNQRLDRVRSVLLNVRNQRPQPATDDKILTGWNGLMIGALADAGRALNENAYVIAAKDAASVLLSTMKSEDGGLFRCLRQGRTQINAFLEDYAFVCRGLLSLHRATGDAQWINESARLIEGAQTRFWDDRSGGWFDSMPNDNELFVRIKGIHDGAIPSGNAIMLLNLLDLFDATGESRWRDMAVATIRAIGGDVSRRPANCVLSVLAIHRIGVHKSDAPITSSGDQHVQAYIEGLPIEWDDHNESEVRVILEVKDGWHIGAADEQASFPLSIAADDAALASALPRYPTGVSWQGEAGHSQRVLNGRVSIPVRLRRRQEGAKLPRLVVAYQACDDRRCLEPQRLVLELGSTSRSAGSVH